MRSSSESHGAQVSRSRGVGLFSGGAQLTAATMRVPMSRCPSPAVTLVGCAARPDWYSDANRKSPLRSPVKTLPVLLSPCAAGASPRMRIDGGGSPQPAIGRPQYYSAAKDLRQTAATSPARRPAAGTRGTPTAARSTPPATPRRTRTRDVGSAGHGRRIRARRSARSSDALDILKRGYGWGGTRLDGRNGAASWCGHGVFAHSLVKISALAG